MAVTQNNFTGDGSTVLYNFTFPYLAQTDVKVKLDGVDTTAYSFANATTVQMNSAPANGVKVIVYRNTDNDNKKATFYPGSAIKAEDLNNNIDQILYVAQEVDNNALSSLGDTPMQGDLQLDQNKIVFEGSTADAHETSIGVVDPTADRTINFPNVSGNVVTTGDSGTVTSAMIADGTIVNADIKSNANIDEAKLISGSANQVIHTANDGSTVTWTDSIDLPGTLDVTGLATFDGSIAASGNSTFSSVSISGGSINGTTIGPSTPAAGTFTNLTVNGTTTLAAGSINTSEIADDAVTTDKIANNAITGNKMASGSIVNSNLTSNCITSSNIGNDQVTSEKIADGTILSTNLSTNSITTEKIVDSNVTTAKIADDAITSAKIATNAITTSKIADAELSTLAGMPTATASALASSTALDVSTTEINRVVKNKYVETSITNSDNAYPTSGAVIDYVAAQIAPLGGLEVITNEDSFPATQPASGVVISIADAGGIVVNGSGVSTTARTSGNGSDNVTINGFPSTLHSTTLADSMGLLVSSTGSSNTYTYHKLLGKEDDIKNLSDDINDFNARYRIASSAPSSNNDDGDLYFDTTSKKMKVYNASTSAWDDVASSSSSYIVTLSESFNGTLQDFTMSTAATDAQSTIVSINGVIQKPNAGTSTPSEGFAISGNTLKLAAAPPTGSDYFIVVLGDTVSIGTPSDNTVSTAKIQNGAVTAEKLAADAVPQLLTGNTSVKAVDTGSDGKIEVNIDGTEKYRFTDGSLSFATGTSIRMTGIAGGTGGGLHLDGAGNNGRIAVFGNSGTLKLLDSTSSADTEMAVFNKGGASELYHAGNKKIETLSTGAKITGTLDVTTTGSDAALFESTAGGADGVQISLRATSASPADDDKLGILDFSGRDDAGNNTTYAQIRSHSRDVSNGSEDGDITFHTRADGSFAERMCINSSGLVGIGTTSPTGIHSLAKVLEISGGDGGDLIIGNNASSNIGAGAHIGSIAFKNIDSSTGSVPHYAGIRCEAADTSGNMDLRFYTGIANLEADTPQVCINSTGLVGINTDSPGWDLDLRGSNATLNVEGTGWAQLRLTGGASENYITSDDQLSFYVGGGEKMVITTTGNVGIGTDDPFAPTNYAALELSGTTGGAIAFSDDEVVKWEIYGSDDEMGFYNRTNTEYRLKLYKTGNVEIINGDLVVANGHGIDFSNQTWTSATGANTDSEVLDHYEEGTWIPKIRGTTTAGTFTANAYNAKFTRIGDVVTLTMYISYQLTGSAGYWELYDLPFTARSGNYAAGAFFAKHMDHSGINDVLYIGSSGTTISIYGSPDDASWARLLVDNTSVGTDQGIIGSITYKVPS